MAELDRKNAVEWKAAANEQMERADNAEAEAERLEHKNTEAVLRLEQALSDAERLREELDALQRELDTVRADRDGLLNPERGDLDAIDPERVLFPRDPERGE